MTRGRTPQEAAEGLSGQIVLRIGRWLASHGHDPEPLYREHGWTGDSLGWRGARVPFGIVEAIGERAGELVGVTDVGLHLGRTIAQPESFEDAGIRLLMASATVEAAIGRAVRIQELWGDGARTIFARVEGGGRVRYVYPVQATSGRHIDECAMAETIEALRYMTGEPVRPRVVRFRHAAPPDTREHEALFRAPLEFEAPHTELELDDAVLALPMRGAHEVFREVFEREVERALAERPRARALAAQVRSLLGGALDAPEDALGRIARALRTSRRTLQRRLQDEGTSFGDLLREVRVEHAERDLARGVPIKQIAARLGYAEPSTFHRAFKRWTGRTPDERRRER